MIKRKVSNKILKSIKEYPIVSISGPRQSGKTTLLKAILPNKYKYYNLENATDYNLASSDPELFLKSAKYMIIDEAQRVPAIFNLMQVIVDEEKREGQFVISGSQQFLLNNHISQSLAGRVSLITLFPLTVNELENREVSNVDEWMLKGFYPRLYDKNLNAFEYYANYTQTYIERDVRELSNVVNLVNFKKFLEYLASITGQELNIGNISSRLGLNVKTINNWLSILEASSLIFLLRPHMNNLGKRIAKAPKLYFYDTGVVCSLLGIDDVQTLRKYINYGSIFENFVIADNLKLISNHGNRLKLFYYRENNNTEIDLIVDDVIKYTVVEIKSSDKYSSDFSKNLVSYKRFVNETIELKSIVVYQGVNLEKTGLEVMNWLDYLKSSNYFTNT